ncbi:hypothetical protein DV515_00001970, partial [Chloebia gouldiae]
MLAPSSMHLFCICIIKKRFQRPGTSKRGKIMKQTSQGFKMKNQAMTNPDNHSSPTFSPAVCVVFSRMMTLYRHGVAKTLSPPVPHRYSTQVNFCLGSSCDTWSGSSAQHTPDQAAGATLWQPGAEHRALVANGLCGVVLSVRPQPQCSFFHSCTIKGEEREMTFSVAPKVLLLSQSMLISVCYHKNTCLSDPLPPKGKR